MLTKMRFWWTKSQNLVRVLRFLAAQLGNLARVLRFSEREFGVSFVRPKRSPRDRPKAQGPTAANGSELCETPGDRVQWGRPVTRASVLNPAAPLAAC